MPNSEMASKFFGRGEIEVRRYVSGNKVMVGKFYADGTVIASFNPDNRFLDSAITLREYRGADEVAAARRLLEERLDMSADFSAFFA